MELQKLYVTGTDDPQGLLNREATTDVSSGHVLQGREILLQK